MYVEETTTEVWNSSGSKIDVLDVPARTVTILTLFRFSFRGYIAYILNYPCSGKVSYVRRRSAIAYVSQTTVLVEIGSRKDSCF